MALRLTKVRFPLALTSTAIWLRIFASIVGWAHGPTSNFCMSQYFVGPWAQPTIYQNPNLMLLSSLPDAEGELKTLPVLVYYSGII